MHALVERGWAMSVKVINHIYYGVVDLPKARSLAQCAGQVTFILDGGNPDSCIWLHIPHSLSFACIHCTSLII
ncbi:hypothetical protein BDV93DRAFT_529263 [Ceratobasidium sp. AG-I]|nr:hypothetical protein BDV93DRAFT_529263 [Ceratobasidium sp. AG-I]